MSMYVDDGSPSVCEHNYDHFEPEAVYSDDIWDQLPSDCSPDSIEYLESTSYNYQPLTG